MNTKNPKLQVCLGQYACIRSERAKETDPKIEDGEVVLSVSERGEVKEVAARFPWQPRPE